MTTKSPVYEYNIKPAEGATLWGGNRYTVIHTDPITGEASELISGEGAVDLERQLYRAFDAGKFGVGAHQTLSHLLQLAKVLAVNEIAVTMLDNEIAQHGHHLSERGPEHALDSYTNAEIRHTAVMSGHHPNVDFRAVRESFVHHYWMMVGQAAGIMVTPYRLGEVFEVAAEAVTSTSAPAEKALDIIAFQRPDILPDPHLLHAAWVEYDRVVEKGNGSDKWGWGSDEENEFGRISRFDFASAVAACADALEHFPDGTGFKLAIMEKADPAFCLQPEQVAELVENNYVDEVEDATVHLVDAEEARDALREWAERYLSMSFDHYLPPAFQNAPTADILRRARLRRVEAA